MLKANALYIQKQARKFGRCDIYLQNLKTLPTHPIRREVLGNAIAFKTPIHIKNIRLLLNVSAHI